MPGYKLFKVNVFHHGNIITRIEQYWNVSALSKAAAESQAISAAVNEHGPKGAIERNAYRKLLKAKAVKLQPPTAVESDPKKTNDLTTRMINFQEDLLDLITADPIELSKISEDKKSFSIRFKSITCADISKLKTIATRSGFSVTIASPQKGSTCFNFSIL